MFAKQKRTSKLMMPLPLCVILLTGCASANLNNAERLIERHPVGFGDAVNASQESETFVLDALKTVNRLEAVIERQ